MMNQSYGKGLRRPGFLELWSWIHEHTGIAFAEGQLAGLARRIDQRMTSLGVEGYDEYLQLLQSCGPTGEFDGLVDGITTRDTHFFREPGHLGRVVRILAQETNDTAGPIRIWCAGCATGEEPYSLAMMVHSELGPGGLDKLEIVATDISRAALRAAQQAGYPVSAARNMSRDLHSAYFEPKGDLLQVTDFIRNLVAFRQLNLISDPWPSWCRDFRCILCKNVLIYFSQDVRRKLAARLVDALAPGGTLLLGSHESLHDVAPNVQSCQVDDVLVYQRS
jgi:chemotaxis protein methyltransferase CheR